MVNFPLSYKTYSKFYLNRLLNFYFFDLSIKDRVILFINYIKFELLKIRKIKKVEFFCLNGNINFKIINLPFRADRKLNMISSMKTHKLKFEFFEAVNGFEICESDVSYVTLRSKNNLSRGSIGCAISHMKLWEDIASKATDEIFTVFEDDVILPYNFTTKLSQLVKQVPMDFDIIYLGSGSTRGRDIKYFINDILFKSFNPRRGLYAYLLRPKSAKKLIDLIKPFDQIYGGLDTKIGKLSRRGWINAYHLYPSFVDVDTDIVSNIFNFSLRNKKQVMTEKEIQLINYYKEQ